MSEPKDAIRPSARGPDSRRPLRIGVIGSGVAQTPAAEFARRVGREIARAGGLLVCGGLGGVMEAAAAGAAEEGGQVLGLLPGERAGDAAPGVTIPVPTGLAEARNVLVVRASEAVIALAGSWGTLSEAAFCRKLNVPLIGLGDALPAEVPTERARSPEEAVARALALARERRMGPDA